MSPAKEKTPQSFAWWGHWNFETNQTRHWRIGPLDVWIERSRHEWLIQRMESGDPLDASLAVDSTNPPPASGSQGLTIERVAAQGTETGLSLSPLLADRPVVVQPRDPFHIPAGTRIELFVSSPLWLTIRSDDPKESVMVEYPLVRPSDTWIGSSTLAGQPGYSVSTSCRSDLDGLPIRPHRAITSLAIKNRGKDRLTFERIAVPVPNLTAYSDAQGQVWTDGIEITSRGSGPGSTETEVVAGPPSRVGTADAIAKPREVAESGILRVFDALV